MSSVKLSSRKIWLVVGLVSLALAASSLILTPILGLNACYLCVFQRFVFMLVGLTGLIAASGFGERMFGFVVLPLAAIGAGAAGYQSWLQAQPEGSVTCIGGEPNVIERLSYFLAEAMPALFEVSGFCTDDELVIVGLSLANWALIAFSAIFVAGLWALLARRPAR